MALGWLGWPPSEAYAADINSILAGHAGLIARLKAINGTPDQGKRKAPISARELLARARARAS